MMNGHYHPYVIAAIDGEIARLASATEGERNITLFKSTANLASLGLKEGEILHHLKPSAEMIGLQGKELYTTVKSGVKAGQAHPRQVPDMTGAPSTMQHYRLSKAPPAKSGPLKRPAFIPDTYGLRSFGDEVRRHVYRRAGDPVRIKIKRTDGSFVNWYRVTENGRDGWQAAKPSNYVPCPYVGGLDAFDPELVDDVLYWPEGEKDCDTLSSLGVPAFTFGGTGDGLPEGISDYLKGRNIVVLADNDVRGRDHAERKAALAHPIAASVKLVEFAELPPKSDVTDFLKTATIEDLQRRVEGTPQWFPVPKPVEVSGWRRSVIAANELKSKTFKPIRYVVPNYISEGVTIFAGKPKIGKSWMLYDICLACSADRFVLGTIKPAQGNVLYLALEDSQRRLKRRLNKLYPDGNWPDRLLLATEWRRADLGGIQDIAEWCNSVPNPVLVVIDTLEKFRPSARPHAAAYTVDYDSITGLHKLAHERGIAVVVIHHVRKMEADDPFDMVSGTNGLTGAADTILVLKRQAGNVTLHARGRDIDESETACQFNRESCRWTLLGDAGEVHSTGQRRAILEALRQAGEAGMTIAEIMAATERTDRNAVDQLLFKMLKGEELHRVKRGVYAIGGKIDKKERNKGDPTENAGEKTDLINLTDLIRPSNGID